jgi:hypothetical protein
MGIVRTTLAAEIAGGFRGIDIHIVGDPAGLAQLTDQGKTQSLAFD